MVSIVVSIRTRKMFAEVRRRSPVPRTVRARSIAVASLIFVLTRFQLRCSDQASGSTSTAGAPSPCARMNYPRDVEPFRVRDRDPFVRPPYSRPRER